MTNTQHTGPGHPLPQLGRIELNKTSLGDVLQHIADLAKLTFPEVSEASVTVVQGTNAHTAAYTGALALALDEAQYELGHGPCLHAASATTIESVGNMATEDRWPDWTARALKAGVNSSVSIGLPMHGPVSGALNLLATECHAFDDDDIAVVQALASYAGLAMANVHLNNTEMTLSQSLEAVMDGRDVIEQAKGITMGERHCTPEEAIAILATMAQDTSRSIRDVAQALVDRTTETPGL